jgi:hypothetical protein
MISLLFGYSDFKRPNDGESYEWKNANARSPWESRETQFPIRLIQALCYDHLYQNKHSLLFASIESAHFQSDGCVVYDRVGVVGPAHPILHVPKWIIAATKTFLQESHAASNTRQKDDLICNDDCVRWS